MKVNVEIVDGKIDSIELVRDNIALFTVTRWQSKGLSLVAYNGRGLDLYYIYRHPSAKTNETRFRYGLDAIASRLKKSHNLNFKGLLWGVPVSTDYLNDRWYGLNNMLVMSDSGVISDHLRIAMSRAGCENCSIDELLTKVRIYNNP
jgi:hypothetical protein